jgi:hypothetical protein
MATILEMCSKQWNYYFIVTTTRGPCVKFEVGSRLLRKTLVATNLIVNTSSSFLTIFRRSRSSPLHLLLYRHFHSSGQSSDSTSESIYLWSVRSGNLLGNALSPLISVSDSRCALPLENAFPKIIAPVACPLLRDDVNVSELR